MTSAPPVRRRPAPLRASVRRTTRLSPHLVRVTVTGDDLARFRWPGPAGHLKLMLPEPGQGDVVLHGVGPVSAWAETARIGDRVAVSVPRSAGFVQDPAAVWVLLAGDASALPAVATIAPTLTVPVTVYLEVDEPADRVPLDGPVTWLLRNGAPGAELERAVLGRPRPAGRGQVWVATEAGVVRRIRAGLLRDLDRDQVTTRGYWRAGEVNHPDHDFGDDA